MKISNLLAAGRKNFPIYYLLQNVMIPSDRNVSVTRYFVLEGIINPRQPMMLMTIDNSFEDGELGVTR